MRKAVRRKIEKRCAFSLPEASGLVVARGVEAPCPGKGPGGEGGFRHQTEGEELPSSPSPHRLKGRARRNCSRCATWRR